jgi:peptide subunit release factor RF-3
MQIHADLEQDPRFAFQYMSDPDSGKHTLEEAVNIFRVSCKF